MRMTEKSVGMRLGLGFTTVILLAFILAQWPGYRSQILNILGLPLGQ